jgi:hypothetical protein
MKRGEKVSKKQLLKMIESLQSSPKDRIRILGDVGIGAMGVGLGAAAAGTVASVAGVGAIPVLTSAASLVGVTAVVATPIGWTLGVAAAGGALVYGVSRLIRSGGLAEGRKAELLLVYQERLLALQSAEQAADMQPGERDEFYRALAEVVEKSAVSAAQAFRMIEAVEGGQMPLSQGYSLLSAILEK